MMIENQKFLLENFESSLGKRKIYSPEFESGGFKWKIIVYPSGKTPAEKKYVSVYVFPSDYKKFLPGWKIQGKISVGTQGNSLEENVNTLQVIFSQDAYIWGMARVLHHEDLHMSLVEGDLTIIARVDVDEMERSTLQTRLLTQPQIARIVTEQDLVTTTICMAFIDSTVPTLRKLPREIIDKDIWDINNTLSVLRNEGVEVAWLERSLELFKQKREEAKTDPAQGPLSLDEILNVEGSS